MIAKNDFFEKLGVDEYEVKGVFATDVEKIERLGESSADKVIEAFDGTPVFPMLSEVAYEMSDALSKELGMVTGLAVGAFINRLKVCGSEGLTFKIPSNSEREADVKVSTEVIKKFATAFSSREGFTASMRSFLIESLSSAHTRIEELKNIEIEWMAASEAKLLSLESNAKRTRGRRKI